MKIKILVSSLRKWVSDLPIQDPVDRQMASLIQVILLGFIAMIFIAGFLNLAIPPFLSWQLVLIQSFVSILLISIPLGLLRGGYFHASVSVVIALFITFETYAVITMGLLETVGTLLFFTLALILAALMLDRRALLLTFPLIAGVILLGAFREPSVERRIDGLITAINIILLNGLISLFLDQFGLAFRKTLHSSLKREEALQNEINVRKQAEETLRQREWEFKSLANNIPDIVARFDQQLRHVYINDAIETITGIPAQAFIGRTNRDLSMPEEQVILWEDRLRHIFNTGQAGRVEFDFPSPAGLRHFESWLVPEFGPRERVENVLSIARDVTERKQAERALRESEERIQNIIRHTTIMFYAHTPDHVLTYVSPQSREILGCEPEEAMVRWQEFLSDHPSNRQGIEATLRAIETGERQPPYELELISRTGRRIWVQVDESPVVKDGQTIAMVGSATNITERRQAEEELQKSREQFVTIIESAGIGTWQWNVQTGETIFNERWAEIVGYSLEELAPVTIKTWETLTHPDDLQRSAELLHKHFAGETDHYDCECRMKHKDGHWVWIHDRGKVISRTSDGQPLWMYGTHAAITERKQAELRIQHLSRLYATLSEMNHAIMRVKNRDELFNAICRVTVEYGKFGFAWIGLFDREAGQVTPVAAQSTAPGEFPFQSININQAPFKSGLMGTALEQGRIVYSQDIQTDPTMQHWRNTPIGGGLHAAAAIPFQLNGEIFGLLNLYAIDVDFFAGAEQFNLLAEIGNDISYALNTLELEGSRKSAEENLQRNEEVLRLFVEHSPAAIAMLDRDMKYITASRRYLIDYDLAIQDITGLSHYEVFPEVPERWKEIHRRSLSGAIEKADEDMFPRQSGRLDWVRWEIRPWYESNGSVGGIIIFSEVITERKQAREALQEKERLLSESQRIGHVGSWSYDIAADSLQYSDEMYRLLDISPEEFQHNGEAFLRLIYSLDRPLVAKCMEDIRTGSQAHELEFRIFRKNGELSYLRCKGAVASDVAGRPLRFIGTVQDVTERKLAEIQIRQQIERLTALREIDQAISSSFHLNVTLDILLSHLVAMLQVDAADVLLLEPDGKRLTYAAGQGFHSSAMETVSLRPSDSQAFSERRAIHIENLENKPDPRLLTTQGQAEGFVSYVGVPLIVKGKIKGVLEIFQRAPLHPYEEWLDFLNTLAGQAAIAIENATLFENLERSNRELSRAYDATIEGWSRALDLRDKETEGHTQRVTKLTLELARAFGLSEEELLYVRWGALLHDIGKMGVPDHILLKPGGLTEEEWIQMRNHPQYAYALLKPITFLAPALDIPYAHHEKWDGTGYPRGLRGREIPLAARLFAVVDVWDALRSDRPYRPAWTKEEAIEYIQSRAGTHFDPGVVERFVAILSM